MQKIIKGNKHMNTQTHTEWLTGVYLWAQEHPLKTKDIYENNAYDLKHMCERYLGIYVSQDDIARAYRSLGYEVKKIRSNTYLDGYCYFIK